MTTLQQLKEETGVSINRIRVFADTHKRAKSKDELTPEEELRARHAIRDAALSGLSGEVVEEDEPDVAASQDNGNGNGNNAVTGGNGMSEEDERQEPDFSLDEEDADEVVQAESEPEPEAVDPTSPPDSSGGSGGSGNGGAERNRRPARHWLGGGAIILLLLSCFFFFAIAATSFWWTGPIVGVFTDSSDQQTAVLEPSAREEVVVELAEEAVVEELVVVEEGEFSLEENFAEFLNKRGSEMVAFVDAGDAPIVFGATAQRGQAGYAVFGAAESVDPSVVLQAQGDDAYGNHFENTIGLGSQMMVAEPGSILYGPDEDPSIVEGNPHGDWISPITQMLLESDTASVNVAEGAFAWCTAGEMTVSLGDVGIRLDGVEGHNWFLMVRGLFPDGKQDSDLNTTMVFQDFISGHAQCMRYPDGAYVSEGNFLQVAELSHTGGSNCGREGCSGLSVLMFDINTEAWLVLHQSQLNAPWEMVESNWR